MLRPGERLRLTKLLAYQWSRDRTLPALRDQVAAAIDAARQTGWERILVDIGHHGERLMLHGKAMVERPIPPAPEREAPAQPRGREPLRRSRTGD